MESIKKTAEDIKAYHNSEQYKKGLFNTKDFTEIRQQMHTEIEEKENDERIEKYWLIYEHLCLMEELWYIQCNDYDGASEMLNDFYWKIIW